MGADNQSGLSLEGTVITGYDQALALAEGLTSAEQGDVFVRQCAKTAPGRLFLASPAWLAIQDRLASAAARSRREQSDAEVAAFDAEWDALVDEMAELPSVKMAHEFLCRLQVSGMGRAFLSSQLWRRWARARFPELDPVAGEIGPPPRCPQVGDDVLYVSHGTPGGEYGREERTAKVTSAGAWIDVEVAGVDVPAPGNIRRVVQVWDSMACSLTVLNPGGWHSPLRVEFDDGYLIVDPAERGQRAGELIGGRAYRGGSWHWPRPRTTGIVVPPDAATRLAAERLAAGLCPDHGKGCKKWVKTLSGGTHVGGPVG